MLAEKVKGELMEMRGNASASLQFPATDKEEKDIWPLGNSLIQIQPTTFYCQSYNFTNDMFRDQIYTCCLVEVLFIFNALKRESPKIQIPIHLYKLMVVERSAKFWKDRVNT